MDAPSLPVASYPVRSGHDEREARHHAGCLLGVRVQGEVPARWVDEELEGLEGDLCIAKPHPGRDRPEHPRPEPLPPRSPKFHVLRAHLERVAHRGVEERLLAPTVRCSPGEAHEPPDVLAVRRAPEAPPCNLDDGALVALARRPRRGGELAHEKLHESGPVAPVAHVRRVRTPLARTQLVSCRRVHRWAFRQCEIRHGRSAAASSANATRYEVVQSRTERFSAADLPLRPDRSS